MAKTLDDMTDIVRNVTARQDTTEWPDSLLYDYINDFMQTEMPQEIVVEDHFSYLEFTTTADQDTYTEGTDFDLDTDFSALFPPAWIDGNEVKWHMSPDTFYDITPLDSADASDGVPYHVLWYNNELILRPIPDDTYDVKISAYSIDAVLSTGGTSMSRDYMMRFIAYGAALDILADYGETERYAEVFPIYERYREQVAARSTLQISSQRALPRF